MVHVGVHARQQPLRHADPSFPDAPRAAQPLAHQRQQGLPRPAQRESTLPQQPACVQPLVMPCTARSTPMQRSST